MPSSGEDRRAVGDARLESVKSVPSGAEDDVARREVGAGIVERDAHDAARAASRGDVHDARIVARSTTTTPSAGTSATTLRKASTTAVEVRIEVRVIELDVADEEVPRLVVQELRAAVEERRVVLVALEHEVRPGAPPIAAAEVLHLAADEEARVAARVEQQPGRQRRGRRLAVRAGDDDGGLSRQQVLPHRLRQREDGQAPARRLGRLDVVAERGVPDDDGVAVRRHVLGARTPCATGIPRRLEDGRHGRVEGAVAAGDAVALLERGGPPAGTMAVPPMGTK